MVIAGIAVGLVFIGGWIAGHAAAPSIENWWWERTRFKVQSMRGDR